MKKLLDLTPQNTDNQGIIFRREWEQQVLRCTEAVAFATAQDLMRSGDYEAAKTAYSVLEEVYEERENECLRGMAVAMRAMGDLETATIFYAMAEDISVFEASGFAPDLWLRA